MTQKKNSVRDYRFSDGHLKQKADSTAICAERDIVHFNKRAVSNTKIDSFKTLIQEFDDIPTDDELLGEVSIATENKDISAELVRIAIRSIRSMAENKWTTASAHYRAFSFEGLSILNDEQLHRLAKRVIKVATQQLPDLAEEGLTSDFINDLKAMDEHFDNDIDLQIAAIKNRDLMSQERVEKGNMVYKEMVRLCNIGKDLFASTNEARYNDYIIYDTPTGNAPATKDLTGSIHGNITDAETGKIISDVIITLDKVAETIESDEDGDYEKLEVPTNCAFLTAVLFGYEEYKANITIAPGEDLKFDFMMTPKEILPLALEEEE